MKVVLQRVKSAYVKVDSIVISEIDNGYLLLWGIEEADSEVESEILINKILNFRVFSDENLKMNKSIIDISGEILIVSQFTLAGKFLKYVTVKTGSFGAMMDVGLVNDGPATFVLTARDGQLIDQAD